MLQDQVVCCVCLLGSAKLKFMIAMWRGDRDLTAREESPASQQPSFVMGRNARNAAVRNRYHRFDLAQEFLIVKHDALGCDANEPCAHALDIRSEEHTSELQSLTNLV